MTKAAGSLAPLDGQFPDMVIREVKVGDIIIIPAGVPHGWATIPGHVDYLSIRPDPDRVLTDDSFHPSLNRTAP